MDEHITPEPILQLGLAFWGSKTLLSAVELGLFTNLAAGPRSAKAVAADLELHPRGVNDFLDALVALDMLEHVDGDYRNAPAADLFLDRNKPSYVGGLLEMANARLYPFWGSLTEALRTGHPQNEAKVGENFFTALYEDADRLEQFLHAMTGISMGDAHAIADQFPWDRYTTVIDIGTSEGCLPVQVALLTNRLQFYPGDFFTDALPPADVLVMGHILHDWSLDEKLMLLRKAYEALPAGGALIVYESIIDDDRRANAFGLLMSLNMLIETQDGFDYTGADCQSWLRDIGFESTYVQPLAGPDSMVVGIKPT